MINVEELFAVMQRKVEARTRITERLRLEGTSGPSSGPTPCLSRAT